MDSIASRYAIAWLKLGEERQSLPLFREQVLQMLPEFQATSPLYQWLMNAFIETDEKYALIDRVFKEEDWVSFASFIKVIVQKKRMKYLPSIFQELSLIHI